MPVLSGPVSFQVETLEVMLAPMAKAAADPLGSMGNDSPLAHMSQRPKLMYGACVLPAGRGWQAGAGWAGGPAGAGRAGGQAAAWGRACIPGSPTRGALRCSVGRQLSCSA